MSRSCNPGGIHPDYRSHVADTELTIIAKATEQFVYAANSVLVEIDPDKIFQTKRSMS